MTQVLQKYKRKIDSSSRRHRGKWWWDVEDAASTFFDLNETDVVTSGYSIGATRLTARDAQLLELRGSLELPLVYSQAFFAIGAHINFKVSTAWRPDRRQGNKLDVLTELHAHALLIAEEAVSQIASGFPQGGEARWRSLFELMVVTRVIAECDDRTAARYKSSHFGELVRTMKKQREASGYLHSTDEWESTESKLTKALDRAKATHGAEIRHQYGWAAEFVGKDRPSFSDLARNVLSGDELANMARYAESSHHVHAGRLGSIKALQVKRVDGIPVFLPKRVDTFTTFVQVFDVLDDITRHLCIAVHETHDQPSAVYWAYFCHMVSLDVSTEAFRSWRSIDPSHLNRVLGVAEI